MQRAREGSDTPVMWGGTEELGLGALGRVSSRLHIVLWKVPGAEGWRCASFGQGQGKVPRGFHHAARAKGHCPGEGVTVCANSGREGERALSIGIRRAEPGAGVPAARAALTQSSMK